MKIILDSNAIYNDPLLESAPLRTLEAYLSSTCVELCIPEVVIEEIVRHFKANYRDARANFDRATRFTTVIGLHVDELPPVDDAVIEYRTRLKARLEAIPARVLAIPSTEARSLLFRDLEERKPFDGSGRGLRDTLIWESILEECQAHSDEIVLVSNDRAFGSKTNEDGDPLILHADLQDDLKSRGILFDRISMYSSLHSFTTSFLASKRKDGYREGQEIEGTVAEGLDAQGVLLQHGDYAVERLHHDLPFIIPMPSGWIERVSFLRWPEDPRIIVAFEIASGETHVQVRTAIVFDVEITSSQDSYHQLFEFSKGKPVIVGAPSWIQDTGVFRFEARMSLLADFIFIWDKDSNEVFGFDLVHLGFFEADMG